MVSKATETQKENLPGLLALLKENTFYPLTRKEGRRYERRRLPSIIVGPTLHPPKAYVKHLKKRQQHPSVNDVAELTQFKDLLKKKGRNEVGILTLLVHHLEEVASITNHSIPMVVKRNNI